jgi:hypothetical protein
MNELQLHQSDQSHGLSNPQSFDHVQRVAKALSSSTVVPKDYQNNIPNTIVALEMAHRIGCSPMMVMQNMDIIHGKPSWKSTFIIASINSSKRFDPLQFEMSGEGDNYGCVAWTRNKHGDVVRGPKVTIGIAKAEGWYQKTGSKWKTIPELMLQYRSAAFFGRLHCPEILMGMHTADEVIDITPQRPAIIEAVNSKIETTINLDIPE